MAHEEECHTAQAAKGQGQRTHTREGNPRMRRNAGSRTQKQEAVHEKGGMLGGARLERTGTAHQNEEGVHKRGGTPDRKAGPFKERLKGRQKSAYIRGGTPDRKVGHSRNGWDAGKRTWESQRFERRPEGVHGKGGMPDRKAGPFEERLKGRQKNIGKLGHSRNGWDAGKRTWESQRFERRLEGVHGKGGTPDRKAGPFEERLKGRQKNIRIPEI
ncbi:hypothetical protein F5887DRAFT_918709 [Amanita rubescens]|nr:hypothetical protein F5887DRAFT_918709 [Amanita rubescens]